MRQLLILLCFLAFTSAQAQTYHGWKLGICGGPLHYWYHNNGLIKKTKDYGNYNYEKPYFMINKMGWVNGFSLGICAEKRIRKDWIFRTELDFSHQKQNYTDSRESMNKLPFLNVDITSKFNFIKLPIMVGYQIPLNKRKSVFLQINQGLQISFLCSYKLTSFEQVYNVAQALDSLKMEYYWVKSVQYIYDRNLSNNTFTYFSNFGSHQNNGYIKYANWPYKRLQIGTITDIGIKGQLPAKWGGFEHWYYNASIRFEYDISSPESKNKSKQIITSFIEPFPYQEEKTHNIRAGLNLSIMYHFNKR